VAAIDGRTVGRRLITMSARYALIAVAVIAALLAILAGFASVPEPDRNPHSPEFGWLQWNWALAVAIATLLLGAAIAASRGRVRWTLIGLLLAMWMCGIEPAIQLFRERIVPHVRGNIRAQPGHPPWPNVFRASAG
jgi:hypothetical protein